MTTRKQRPAPAKTVKKPAAKKIKTSTLADKVQRPKARATKDQGPEYQKLLDEAHAKNTDMAHVRGLSKSKLGSRVTPNTDSIGTNPNPSPATRLKKGENALTLRERKILREKAIIDDVDPKKQAMWAQHALDAAERKRLAKEAGMTPLEFLLSIMCDSGEKLYVRMDAAKIATPYFHRKMPIAIDNGAGGPVGVYTKEQLARLGPQELALLEQLMVKLSNEFPVPSVPANATDESIVQALANGANLVELQAAGATDAQLLKAMAAQQASLQGSPAQAAAVSAAIQSSNEDAE